jgi:hypothetical protein
MVGLWGGRRSARAGLAAVRAGRAAVARAGGAIAAWAIATWAVAIGAGRWCLGGADTLHLCRVAGLDNCAAPAGRVGDAGPAADDRGGKHAGKRHAPTEPPVG